MAEKYKIKHKVSKVETDVSAREWEAIQKNELVGKNYIVVLAPAPKVVASPTSKLPKTVETK